MYIFLVFFIVTAVNTLTPKIEQYSQHAAVEFYKAIAGKNFYVETVGFKSYAYLFYSEKKPEQNQNPQAAKSISENLESLEKQGFSRISSYSLAYANWMQYGEIDRPAVFVTKINNAEGLLANPEIKKLYSKNGFVFCVRMPGKKQ